MASLKMLMHIFYLVRITALPMSEFADTQEAALLCEAGRKVGKRRKGVRTVSGRNRNRTALVGAGGADRVALPEGG